ncbi:hypothetical protein [Aurantiacibacter gangjinensis]|uniref:Uncharacterized protein n=1 Tax=Aurantiacibacter gangjinensis TaxID=502682 RepID=A0A0G9MQ40_9SPHN|nr:hypothetical protein [Aurantiacibacter gangjinensis]APE28478.1 hypothetical protein BMF35_a1649 [Aurantiacibacter gangjinensis]KLE32684.1 hypothetical protein AAW01_01115 [Aurantiacibacter gangjinensis]
MEFVILFIPLLLVLVVPQLVGRALGRRDSRMSAMRGALLAALPALFPFLLLGLLIAASDQPMNLSVCTAPLCDADTGWWELLAVLAVPCFIIALLLGWWGFRMGRRERDEDVVGG